MTDCELDKFVKIGYNYLCKKIFSWSVKQQMDADGARSQLLFPLLFLFVIFFFYAEAETAVTEFPNQKIRGFEHEKGVRGGLYSLQKKASKMMAVFLQIKILSAIYAVAAMYLAVSAILVAMEQKMPGAFMFAIALAVGLIVFTTFFHSLPRRLIRSQSAEQTERFALFCVPAVQAAVMLFTPIMFLSHLIVKLLTFIFRIKNPETETEVTEEEILMMVDAGTDTGAIEESQAEMITNIFEFSDTPVSDIMTHRTDIIAVKSSAAPAEIAAKAAETGFSRLPTFDGSIDRITGIICVKDLLALVAGYENNYTAEHYKRPVIYLPETATAKNVFKKLTESKMQMAVIIDEYGGTAGIVTIEDLLETIVGSIQDEYDDECEDVTQISETSFTIDGLANPADVLSELKLPLPESFERDKFDTMSAFLMELAGALPDDMEAIFAEYAGWRFTATDVDDMRITKINAEKLDDLPQNNSRAAFETEKSDG
jgi:putative hemolysin